VTSSGSVLRLNPPKVFGFSVEGWYALKKGSCPLSFQKNKFDAISGNSSEFSGDDEMQHSCVIKSKLTELILHTGEEDGHAHIPVITAACQMWELLWQSDFFLEWPPKYLCRHDGPEPRTQSRSPLHYRSQAVQDGRGLLYTPRSVFNLLRVSIGHSQNILYSISFSTSVGVVSIQGQLLHWEGHQWPQKLSQWTNTYMYSRRQ